MNALVKTHSSKDSIWINAAGDKVPANFLTIADKKREASSAKIRNTALVLEKKLGELYELMNDSNTEITAAIKGEYELKKGKKKGETKGNLTWFNFDRSIKVLANVNELAKWDKALMAEALALLNEFIENGIGAEKRLFKKLITGGFTNARGDFDPKKVFQILKYETDAASTKYSKACELIRQAQSVGSSKMYMQVFELMEDGSYRNINLNFSSL